MVILTPVPAVTVAEGASGAGLGLGFACGAVCLGAGVGVFCTCSGVGAGEGGTLVCGCSWPWAGSIGLDASRLSLLAPVEVFWAAFCPQPAARSRARVAIEAIIARRMAIGDPPVRRRLPCRA